jgi:hypothetical protein
MDNTRDLPGYKYYVDAQTGERPALFVVFVSVSEAARPDAEPLNGVLFPVEPVDLPALDARERNYERREVTGLVPEAGEGRVWTYVGSDAARERYATGAGRGAAAVSAEYLDAVRESFRALGEGELERFGRTTVAPAVPVRALRRVDLPEAPDAPPAAGP